MAMGRYLSIAVGAGVVAALALLTGPAHVAEFVKPAVARAPITNPPSVSCKKQEWYNADRACLSWTAPRPDNRAQQAAMSPVPLLSH